MRVLKVIGYNVGFAFATGPSFGLTAGFVRRTVGGLVVAGALLLSAGCGGGDNGSSSDTDPPAADPVPTSSPDSTDSTSSSAPTGDASEIETWIAQVYLVGHDIGDYTGCLADAVTGAAEEEIPAALEVKSNAELNTAYQTAPKLMDALIAAQNGECAEFAD